MARFARFHDAMTQFFKAKKNQQIFCWKTEPVGPFYATWKSESRLLWWEVHITSDISSVSAGSKTNYEITTSSKLSQKIKWIKPNSNDHISTYFSFFISLHKPIHEKLVKSYTTWPQSSEAMNSSQAQLPGHLLRSWLRSLFQVLRYLSCEIIQPWYL